MVRETEHKRALISEVAKQNRLDVLFLQETHTNPADETDWGSWSAGFVYL